MNEAELGAFVMFFWK